MERARSTVSHGIPGKATASFPASVSDIDIVGGFAAINYNTVINGTAATLQYPSVAGPGVAFDNTLTRSATITPTGPAWTVS